MDLQEIMEHNRQFSLDISESELAVLMNAAANYAGNYPEGSGARNTCESFVRECDGWKISPENHGL